MAETQQVAHSANRKSFSKRAEFLMFLALAFGVWPVVAVAVVGGFGFLVWMSQLIFGPSGPPASLH